MSLTGYDPLVRGPAGPGRMLASAPERERESARTHDGPGRCGLVSAAHHGWHRGDYSGEDPRAPSTHGTPFVVDALPLLVHTVALDVHRPTLRVDAVAVIVQAVAELVATVAVVMAFVVTSPEV